MSKTNTFENELLVLLFNNLDMEGIGDVNGILGSATAGNFYVSLHTADPGENQATNECGYTGYARVAVARSVAGWTVTGNSVSPAANVTFGEATGALGGTITHFGVGDDPSGGGKLRYKGAVTPTVPIALGVIPVLKSTTSITED